MRGGIRVVYSASFASFMDMSELRKSAATDGMVDGKIGKGSLVWMQYPQKIVRE